MKKQFLLPCILSFITMFICFLPAQAQNNLLQTGNAPALNNQFAGKAVDIRTASLAWKPASETGILSFELQRSTDSVHFVPILLMQAKGGIKKPNGYTYTDTELSAPHYFYRLYIQNFNGLETYSSVLRVVLKAADTLTTETARLR